MILTVRTDKPIAELGLFSQSGEQKASQSWHAHRELSTTLLSKFETLLQAGNVGISDISGVIFYVGPGSFTGLRIGAAFVNALEKPLFGATGVDWVSVGMEGLRTQPQQLIMPEYGAPPHITQQKK